MSILKIVLYPDERLRERAQEIKEMTDEVRQMSQDMLDTMYDGNGIGLAANQVGILKRIIVMDVEQKHLQDGSTLRVTPLVFFNPEITWASEEKAPYVEGCLSIPGINASVMRPKEIKIKYRNENFDECELSASGLLATCIQHEIDHINGVLFLDYLSPLKRSMLMKKINK